MSFHEYSSDYYPSMPVCQVYLGPSGKEPTLGPLEAILDIGADVTVVPTKYLRQFGAKAMGTGRAHSIWGDSKPVELYAVSFRLDHLRFKALRVLADDTSDGIAPDLRATVAFPEPIFLQPDRTLCPSYAEGFFFALFEVLPPPVLYLPCLRSSNSHQIHIKS